MKIPDTLRGALPALLATLALVGCDAMAPATTDTAPTENTAATSSPSCPAEAFEPFLSAFAGNVELQRAFTARPLQSDSLDTTADPEPSPVTRMLDDPDIDFPLLASLEQLRSEGVELQTSSISTDKRQVRLRKDDTGFNMTFHFRRNGCWQLYRMENDSL